jgi:uncharacterized protein (DUF1330 family)
MKSQYMLALALIGGIAFGATVVDKLGAQGKGPGAYVVIDINEISDANAFKTLLPKTAASNAAFNGQTIAQTEKIAALDGSPPKRFVIIAFDSMDRAKAWYASAAQNEINSIRIKSTKSRAFIVDGMIP